jgi:hypothetical protein
MNMLSWWSKASHSLRLLILLAAAGWIIFAFRSYLPAIFLSASLDFLLRRTGTYDVILVLWFADVAYCVGKRFLRLLGVTAAAGAEEAAFSMTAGAMLFSWTMLILSQVHGLYRPVAYLLLLVPSAIWHGELCRLPRTLWRLLISKTKSLSWTANAIGRGFIGLYIMAVLGIVLISALGPSFEFDDLVYHLTGPKNFILAHKFIPLPDVPLVFFPKNIEMLHTLGMLLHNDITAKLLVFLCGCMTMVGVYGFSARFISRGTGLIAVAILASTPLFIWEMRTAHNDVGLATFLFAGIYAVAVWLRTREKVWFRLACVFLAFCLGAKYWAILALGIIIFLVFIASLLQSRKMLPAFSNALKLGFYSSLGLLPWGIVNFCYTGNPLFPLFNDVFRSPFWTNAHTKMAIGEMFQGGIRITFTNLWDLFRLPWEMMVDPRARFGGNIGPWYVIFIPFLVFSSGIGLELGFVIATGLLYYVGWAVSGPWVRFLIPALPCLAVGAAFAVMRLFQFLDSYRRIMAIAAGVLLGVFAILASPYFEEQNSWARYGNTPLGTLPVKYLSGGESRSDYLHRFHNQYRIAEYLNQIPGDKKVLYVYTTPDGFYLKGKAAFHYSPYVPGLAQKDAGDIHRILRQHGITHVVVEQDSLETSSLSSRESDFTQQYLRKIFQGNAFLIYELLPDRITQQVVGCDFLAHLDDTSAGQMPRETTGSAYKTIRSVGGERRYTLVTSPPSDVEFPVRIPDSAALSFAAARENPGCTGKGSIQIWITTLNGKRHLVYSCELEGNAGSWIENEVDLNEYAGRQVTITFRTEDPTRCCSYFLADPVLMAPNSIVSFPENLQDRKDLRHDDLAISGGRVSPGQPRLGQSIEVSFSGPSLNADTYFDIRFRAPDNSADQTVLNYQKGTSSHHEVVPGTQPGTYVITGVRAHRLVSDHEGDFHPLWMQFNVTP